MPGAETVTGDLADPGSLSKAISGVEKVFLLSSPHRDPAHWHQCPRKPMRPWRCRLKRAGRLRAARQATVPRARPHVDEVRIGPLELRRRRYERRPDPRAP
jgi:hypothetical protein